MLSRRERKVSGQKEDPWRLQTPFLINPMPCGHRGWCSPCVQSWCTAHCKWLADHARYTCQGMAIDEKISLPLWPLPSICAYLSLEVHILFLEMFWQLRSLCTYLKSGKIIQMELVVTNILTLCILLLFLLYRLNRPEKQNCRKSLLYYLNSWKSVDSEPAHMQG